MLHFYVLIIWGVFTNVLCYRSVGRGGREAYGAALEKRFPSVSGRGFKSHPLRQLNYGSITGEMLEWPIRHAWKACRGAILSWVRIPPSPPAKILSTNGYLCLK